MISLEKITQQLQQTKDANIVLPKISSKYTQATAIEIRKNELELLNTNFNLLNEANYTMDSEFEKINKENESIKTTLDDLSKSSKMKESTISNKALIVYTENEAISQLPEIILSLINDYNKSQSKMNNTNSTNNINNINKNIDKDLLYIYGIKNPDSFYKSFLLLSKLDFIIKNKSEQKNDISTFKREMAIEYETFYKNLNYRKLRFIKANMIHNLTEVDNYNDYDLFQYICDYTKNNLIILDIINEKYCDINYNKKIEDNKKIDDSQHNQNTNKYLIIIKYSANTFLPLMYSSGNHYFDSTILNTISKSYERIIFNKFKELSVYMKEQLNNETKDNDYNSDNEDEIEPNTNTNTQIFNIDDIEDVDNILEQNSLFNIEEAFNNSIKLQCETLENNENNLANLINIETMIEVVEEDTIDNSNKTNSSNDSFDLLMNTIPTTQNNKLVKTKVKTSKTEKPKKTNTLDSKKKTEEKEDKKEDKKEELLPISKYTLTDLQRFALFYKIDKQKMGNAGKKINKLKAELYEEIETAKNKSSNAMSF